MTFRGRGEEKSERFFLHQVETEPLSKDLNYSQHWFETLTWSLYYVCVEIEVRRGARWERSEGRGIGETYEVLATSYLTPLKGDDIT